MRGIALGDEPGYYIDTAYITRGYLHISVKPGIYNFDPISRKDTAVKYPTNKLSVFKTTKLEEKFTPGDSLTISRTDNELIVPLDRNMRSSLIVGTASEFGMFATLIQIKKNQRDKK